MGENIVEVAIQMTIWHMRIACWIRKATNTRSKCVILIAFPIQQWLYETAFMLRYTYIVCPVDVCNWCHMRSCYPLQDQTTNK